MHDPLHFFIETARNVIMSPSYHNPNALEDIAKALAKKLSMLFDQFQFDEPRLTDLLAKQRLEENAPHNLKQTLDELNTQLHSKEITAKQYCEHTDVQRAYKMIMPQRTSCFLMALRLWWQEPHAFGVWEKTVMTSSMIIFTIGLILVPQNLALLAAKQPLTKTGNAIDDFCSPAVPGLTPKIVEICSSLSPGTKAVFDFTAEADNLPICTVPTNTSACASTQHIGGFIPLDWFVYAVCEMGSHAFKIVGHVLSGSPADVQARHGIFPVVTLAQPITLFVNVTIQLMLTEFFPLFCLIVKEGGRGTFGHTDGFQRPAEDFGFGARIFGAVYGFMLAAASLFLLTLQLKKMIAKWNHSGDKRSAYALFKQFTKLLTDETENTATSTQTP
ncbi:MAG: hypothetical protein A3C44_01655 [Gammaproteobacteria bacterium RIFCSPHIGHO2_02_FULL_39_13]|nr:MAG: hypothetical protein A3C44_01655 [Gammaproteobacteria bacterium RIFCSPHIGHO2_02_FULL_39_13]OGT49589.1 MAG: hypothetical protein A3E53_00400 [Gammaproteobacteria bacterium RIFCSPHIGHO2_12_FULL_39_24]